MENYKKLHQIGEGAFGKVYKGLNLFNKKLVAIKEVHFNENAEGYTGFAIREMSLLNQLKHPNIVTFVESIALVDRLCLIFEFMPMDLKTYIRLLEPEESLGEELVRYYLYQLSSAIAYCHRLSIMHRDIKPRNLLINGKGVLKVADFGMARLYKNTPHRYTPKVSTLFYKAPELLLGQENYDCSVDIWAIGCTFAEISTKKVLFPGRSHINQIMILFSTLTTPTEETWPGITSLPSFMPGFTVISRYELDERLNGINAQGIDLIKKMLVCNPANRILAKDIIKHPYFEGLNPETLYENH